MGLETDTIMSFISGFCHVSLAPPKSLVMVNVSYTSKMGARFGVNFATTGSDILRLLSTARNVASCSVAVANPSMVISRA